MSTDLKAIMARAQRVQDMIADPDLTGDTLLFALCLDEVLHRKVRSGRRRLTRSNWVREVTELAEGDPTDAYWAKRVLTGDTPRYEPEGMRTRVGCVAPMIRREGPCGKNTHTSFVDRDPVTGEGTYVGYCTRHWSHEKDMERLTRWKAWEANGKPSPGPNHGGVLKRYFRHRDWDGLYRWASGREPLAGAREATPPRPVFTVIQGGT